MNIAYVLPRYTPHTGGVETHVAQIARRLAADGHDVDVLTQERDCQLPSIEEIDGVRVRRFPVLMPAQRYVIAPGLWTYLAHDSTCYDIVHAHSYHDLPSLATALAVRRPIVFTPHYHGTGHTRLGRVLHLPYRVAGAWIVLRSRRVICVSSAEAALVRRHFPHAARRITVIPNGVEPSALQTAEPYQVDNTIVLTCGRLMVSKNVDRVIEALAHLDNRFALCVIGEGPVRAALEQLAERLNVRERVWFQGRVDDETLHRWLRTAAVYVSMSRQEAFGITVAQALVAGTVVVASDIPPHAEVLAAAGNGAARLLPLGASPSALARAIEEAAEHPASEPACIELLSWDAVAAQTFAVYQEVLGTAR